MWDLDSTSAVVQEDEALALHRLGNPSATETAVSVHIYSPPLKELRYCKPPPLTEAACQRVCHRVFAG